MILSNRKTYQNFTTLKTNNAITKQWNAIKYKDSKYGGKAQVTIEELDYILQHTTNKDVYADVLTYYNPKAKRLNKTTSSTYRVYNRQEATKKGINKEIAKNRERIRDEKKAKYAEELYKQLGFETFGKTYVKKIGDEYIVNPRFAKTPFEKIEKNLLKSLTKKGLSSTDIEIEIAKEKLKFDRYKEELRKLKKDNSAKKSKIEEITTERLNKFLFEHEESGIERAGYFGNITGKIIEKEKLKKLMEQLNPAEKLAVESLMLDNDFLKVWGSKQGTSHYRRDFREKRLDEIIKILENHLELQADYNPVTGEIDLNPLSSPRATETSLTLKKHL